MDLPSFESAQDLHKTMETIASLDTIPEGHSMHCGCTAMPSIHPPTQSPTHPFSLPFFKGLRVDNNS